ncbi:Serine/threonine-protein kinase PknB [Symmachiella dynata]|nr:Serine/threonine-protein kinase PknB [Symmachiella dynata]
MILGDFGEVVVLDWGLAKRLAAPDEEIRGPITTAGFEPAEADLTISGEIVGTPAYMAPEQTSGRIDLIDHCTDVYGRGAMLYEILTGEPPFSGEDTREVLRKVQDQLPIPPRQLNDEIPDLLDAVCLKALAREPSSRHTSVIDLANEVERWQETQRKKAEKALRDSEALYRSLVDHLPIYVSRSDLEGRITFCNKGLCELFGRTGMEKRLSPRLAGESLWKETTILPPRQ